MATNEKGEVITKIPEAAKSAETPSAPGEGGKEQEAPLPLLKPIEDRASDSDSEQGRRRKSARRVLSKLAKDSEGSADEDGAKSGSEGNKKSGKQSGDAGGTKENLPGKGKEKPQEMDASVGGAESSGSQETAPGMQPLHVQTEGGAHPPVVGGPSPARIMKARKSFPAHKARGMDSDDDDDDGSMDDEYIVMLPDSPRAMSEDAFEIAPILRDELSAPQATPATVSSGSASNNQGNSDLSQIIPAAVSTSNQRAHKSLQSSKTGEKADKRVSSARTSKDTKEQPVPSAKGKPNSLNTAATQPTSASSGQAIPMETASSSSATVDAVPSVAAMSRGPVTTHTKARASMFSAAPSKDRPSRTLPGPSGVDPSSSRARVEPVVGAVAESQMSQAGSSSAPMADFPFGNAGSVVVIANGSVVPERMAFNKAAPPKRSTRQKRQTHFGQRSKRKRMPKAISDSDSTDLQSESSNDAGRKKVRRGDSSPSNVSDEDHSYSLKSKQTPVHLTLPDAAGDNPRRGLEPPLCCCKMEQERPATVVASTCEALEVVKGNVAVCGNKVESMTVLRPSTRIPYRALCPDHRVKMLEHKCCPGCGCFCSTGSVMSCSMEKIQHSFHKECIREIEGALYCPHCGDDATFAKEVKLPVTAELEKMKTLPGSVLLSYGQIKLPRSLLQTLGINGNVLNGETSREGMSREETARNKEKQKARISSKKSKEGILENGVEEPEQASVKKYTLKNGTVISTASLPPGPSKDILERALEFLDPINPKRQRFHPKNLYMSSSQGEVDKVLQMLSEGFDPNYRFPAHNLETALHGAASNGHLDIICLLLQSGANAEAVDANLGTPLHAAADNAHLSCVQYLVTCGANINHRDDEGSTILHVATKSGNMDMLGYLLTLAKIDLNVQDNGGWTPVIWAADYKNAVSVRYLLEHGADAFVRDKEQNVGLHWAAYSGCQDVTEVFLNLNKENIQAHLNALNVHGDTPLHISARENHYGCAMQLLVRQADVTIKNNENELALDCCRPKSDVYLAIQANIRMKMAIKRRNIRSEVILSRDIAHGLENVPIPVVNSVNDDGVPTEFLYVRENCETSKLNIDRNIKHMEGCNCQDDCFSESCACSRSSVRCWYDRDGRLMPDFNYHEPPMIFECSRACRCWRNCRNRVVQNGIKQHMQVFRTPSMGWAVRTMTDVPRGSFICEYAGELLSDAEADQRQDDSYLFDLDNREGDVYCIDARYYGNVSRFINHRCEPNIVPVRVFIEHQDLRFPRIAFFASKDIRAYEELGFDYGDKFWAIKSKFFVCCCEAPGCKHKGNKKMQALLIPTNPELPAPPSPLPQPSAK